MTRSIGSFVLLLAAGVVANADDWPRYRGAASDGVWREEGVARSVPEGGFPIAWRVPVDLGYAGPAVADGKVFLAEYHRTEGDITDNPGGRDRLKGVERFRCLDSATGEELWRYEYAREYFISYPSGPRCTPTVDGDRVYCLGAEGDLACLNVADGSVVWKKSFADDFGAPTPTWGHSAHPLIDGDTLYCMVGGKGSVTVAFDKMTGAEKWRALSTPTINNVAGYCPPAMIEHNGAKQLVAFYPTGVSGLDPATGKVHWTVPIESEYEMSIAQPNLIGDRLFTTGYGDVSVCFRLPTSGAEPEILWSGGGKRSISAANVTPTRDPRNDVVYGVDAKSSALIAVDLSNGERLWQTKAPTLGERGRGGHGTAFPVRHGDTDRFWLASETGDLVLARLTPQGYDELGRQALLEPTGDSFGRPVWWSHPAFAERSVFARNDKELIRVNLSAE